MPTTVWMKRGDEPAEEVQFTWAEIAMRATAGWRQVPAPEAKPAAEAQEPPPEEHKDS